MEENKDFPNIWHAILVLLILLGVQLVIGAVFYDLGAKWAAGDPYYGGIITIFSCGIIFSVIMSYKKITYQQLFSPSSQITKPLIIATFAAIIITSCGGIILLADLDTLIIHQFPVPQSDIAMFERLLGSGPVSIITVCVVAPFLEEMLFRGIFLRSFMCNYSTFNAIAFSALLFAIAHLNIYQMPGAYITGIFLGWLYVVTKSLWPSIFAHVTFNAMSLILYSFNGGFEETLNASYHQPITLIISVACVLLGLKTILLISKRMNHESVKIQ